MGKVTTVMFGVVFAAVFLTSGKVFGEENVSAVDASVETLKTTEESLAGLPEGTVPIDEELKDEEVIDTDA